MFHRIRRLLRAESPAELARFAAVGASGVVVNNTVLYLLHGVAGWHLITASVVAVEAAIISNFALNDRWTFSARERASFRFLRFNLVSFGGLVVNTTVLALLVTVTGLHYLLANLVAIGAATTWNFAANARWTWLAANETELVPSRVSGRIYTDDLVVVPTYNEAANLEPLVERVLDEGPFGVLVVDDGSPDGTGRIADELSDSHPGRVAVLHRGVKEGLGAAYRAGFQLALQSDAARIYQMDADHSHDPVALSSFRRALLRGVDLTIGSRYVEGGGVVGWPLWRMLLSRGGSVYAALILRLRQRDLTGGFKGWSRNSLEAIRVGETRSNGYAFQIETTYRARCAGARIAEVAIRFVDRERGASKMGWPIILEAVRVVPGLRLKDAPVHSLAPARNTPLAASVAVRRAEEAGELVEEKPGEQRHRHQ